MYLFVLHEISNPRSCQKCPKITKPKSSDVKNQESRYTIKGALILKYIKIFKDFLLAYLITFVELYIKMHNCNFLMNNRRIVIFKCQFIQNNFQIASLTYFFDQNSC
jgi:hypothetical protein